MTSDETVRILENQRDAIQQRLAAQMLKAMNSQKADSLRKEIRQHGEEPQA